MTDSSPAFALAKASRRVVAWNLLVVGLLALLVGAVLALLSPPPAALLGFWAIMAGIGLVYLLAWAFYRPRRFQVARSGLRVVFPCRSRVVPRADIVGVELVAGEDVWSAKSPLTARTGSTGLLGVYGICQSKQLGLIEIYATRLDGLVLIRRREGRPLLLTPEHPGEFVETVRTLLVEETPSL